MHRRTFPPGRAAEEMCDHGAEKDQRCHAQGNAAPGLMNLIDDEVVAALHAAPDTVVEQADGEAPDRQQEQQPRMREPGFRRDVETPEKRCAKRTDDGRQRHEDHRPARERHDPSRASPRGALEPGKPIFEEGEHGSTVLLNGKRVGIISPCGGSAYARQNPLPGPSCPVAGSASSRGGSPYPTMRSPSPPPRFRHRRWWATLAVATFSDRQPQRGWTIR